MPFDDLAEPIWDHRKKKLAVARESTAILNVR
jgi:hypothetical protein